MIEIHHRPHVGQRVVYHSRPGEGRPGKPTTVADVVDAHADGSADLVVHGLGESRVMENVPPHGDQAPFNSWSPTEHDEHQAGLIEDLRRRLAALEEKIAASL
jgi:hypothetical protein